MDVRTDVDNLLLQGCAAEAAGASSHLGGIDTHPSATVRTLLFHFLHPRSHVVRENQSRTSFVSACCRDPNASMQGRARLIDDGVPR